jgi:protein SCO1
MRPVPKLLTMLLLAGAVLAVVSAISAGLWRRGGVRAADQELPVLGHVPAFQLHDQEDQPVTLASLRGSPWVADFIFTRCPGACPMMTARMAALQHALPPPVNFVSFSVDPEHDTPAVLKEYAQRYAADGSRWRFLTGDQDAIMAQARGMLLTALPATADQPIIHDGRFLLIDGRGLIRGAYRSEDPQELADLDRDAKRLVAETRETSVLTLSSSMASRLPAVARHQVVPPEPQDVRLGEALARREAARRGLGLVPLGGRARPTDKRRFHVELLATRLS